MRVSREIVFNAVHSHHGMLREPKHGHEYHVIVTMEGRPNVEGFVCDFRAVKRLFNKLVRKEFEGKDLDTLFEFPTAEVLARDIWNKLVPLFPLHSITVKEKPHSTAVYYGETR